MDRDAIIELFADFGPVTVRRMFSGYGISVDGVTFALALRAGFFLRADEDTIPRFEAENCGPFNYAARGKTVTVGSYYSLPERLYDDAEAFADWARDALKAAERAKLAKRAKASRGKASQRPKSGQAKRSAIEKSAPTKAKQARKRATQRGA